MSNEADLTELRMKYFVLKPAGTSDYAYASRAALKAYASWIHGENTPLSRELTAWADLEHQNAHDRINGDAPQQLRDCPFCGGYDVIVRKDHTGTDCWWVICRDCDAVGPAEVAGEATAANAWNKRLAST